MKLNLLRLFLVFGHLIGCFASPIAEPQYYDDYYPDDEMSNNNGSSEYIDYMDLPDDFCFLPEELGLDGE